MKVSELDDVVKNSLVNHLIDEGFWSIGANNAWLTNGVLVWLLWANWKKDERFQKWTTQYISHDEWVSWDSLLDVFDLIDPDVLPIEIALATGWKFKD